MENKVDWVIHGVIGDNDTDLTYRTHGLEKYIGMELELCLPVNVKDAEMVLNEIGLEISNGFKPSDGLQVEKIMNVPIRFKTMPMVNGKGNAFRVVLPDENGLFPEDECCNPHYKNQLRLFKLY